MARPGEPLRVPFPVSDLVRENCLDVIERIPFSCAPEPNTKIDMQRCITTYMRPADDCISRFAKCGEGRSTGIVTFFTPYYQLARNIYANLKSISDPASVHDTLSGLHDIYLSSIDFCEPELIGNVTGVLDKAVQAGKLGEMASYIRDKKETDFYGFFPYFKFSNKPATLLLLWAMKTSTGRPEQKCLTEAFKYYPPIPKPPTTEQPGVK